MTWHGRRVSYKATSTSSLVHTDYEQQIAAIEVFFGEYEAIQCDGVTGMAVATDAISISAGHETQTLGAASNDIVYKRTGAMLTYTYEDNPSISQ